MPTSSRSDRPEIASQAERPSFLRRITDRLTPRISWSLERSLYRAYYALPGISDARKRAFIEWLHSHARWLTRNTLSYRVHAQVQELRAARAGEASGLPRMDQHRADALVAAWKNVPLISVAMTVRDVEPRWLAASVDSVVNQFYSRWELCIVDNASDATATRRALEQLAARGDSRIKTHRLKQRVEAGAAWNAALELATGDYVGLLESTDELARDALMQIAQAIVEQEPDLLYSDEDRLVDARHVEPCFKPDYSQDYFFSQNYLRHFSVLRRALLKEVGGFRQGFDGAEAYDLLLRVTERTAKVAHIPEILYHARKATPAMTADEAGSRALAESLSRRGIEAKVERGPVPMSYRVRRALRETPLVSIIVPFRDNPELLRNCVESILAKSTYQRFELLGIDNQSADPVTLSLMDDLRHRDSRVRFIRDDRSFNYSALNNCAVAHAAGTQLLFLNNDTRVISPDWIECLLEHSQRPEVGVVGAKLLYPDDTLQHAGVIVGIAGVAGHPFQLLPAKHPGYFDRAQLIQNLSAVTFACAMTRREVFEHLGGLNETDLAVAFNDVDFCLRAHEKGYLIVYQPNALLYHDESKSRGFEDSHEKQQRFEAETAYIQRRHAAALKKGDPYYNPNLSLLHAFVPADDYVARLPS